MFDRTKEKINRVKENSYSVGDVVDEMVDIAKEDAEKIYEAYGTLYQMIKETIRNRNVKRDNDD